MKKYICYGGYVYSNDGDEHYIPASRLAELYHVPLKECICVNYSDYLDDGYIPKLAGVDKSKFIELRPSSSGYYDLNITEKTNRGFSIIRFNDRYGIPCNIQKSSLATQDCIWLGVEDGNPQIMAKDVMENGIGWVKYPIPDKVMLTTRMHLNQEQAKWLVEILNKFIETGNID